MYQVRLSDFEGPLDLLLFFIQRDELDVYDIPIAQIADEFLEYVRLMDEIDLDSAGEFIYMAALLISIKARMLLPRQPHADDDEIVDPRKELVERLVEYVKFKDAADRLGHVWESRADLFVRDEQTGPAETVGLGEDDEIDYDVSVFQLMSALKRVLETARETTAHTIQATQYSVEEQRDWLRTRIVSEDPISFVELVSNHPKSFIIATFLAILEVVRSGEVRLLIGPSTEDFYLARRDQEHAEEPETE
jgi:segregation and condensation protein A